MTTGVDPTQPPAWLQRTGRAAWAFLGIVGAAVVFVAGAVVLRDVVVPLLLAGFLAVVFAPAVTWLTDRKVPSALAAVIVIGGIAALFVASGYLVVRGVLDQSDQLRSALDTAIGEISDALDRENVSISSDDLTSVLSSGGSGLPGGVTSGLSSAVGSVVTVLSGLVLGVVLLYYLLKDGTTIVDRLAEHAPDPDQERVDRVLDTAAASIRGYFRGRTILAFIQGAGVAVLLWILGVPLPFAVGVVNVIGAYIPYLGAFIGGTFAVLMGLAAGGPVMALVALVIVLFINLVLENLVEPMVMGNTVNLHPIVVLLVTVAGGLVAGLVGLILATPLTSIVIMLWKELRRSGFFQPAAAAVDGADPPPDDG
ncbi:MAG: AI-2E family transporter [Acidimicrobiales bacterium]